MINSLQKKQEQNFNIFQTEYLMMNDSAEHIDSCAVSQEIRKVEIMKCRKRQNWSDKIFNLLIPDLLPRTEYVVGAETRSRRHNRRECFTSMLKNINVLR